jgi:hypothetical protein
LNVIFVKSVLAGVGALFIAAVLYFYIYYASVIRPRLPKELHGMVGLDVRIFLGPFFWVIALLAFAIAFYWEFRRASRWTDIHRNASNWGIPEFCLNELPRQYLILSKGGWDRWYNLRCFFLITFKEETVGMAKHTGTNDDFLAMALVGYEAQIGKIKAAIAGIRARLGHRSPGRPTATNDGATPKKRTMSAAGRRSIAAAQRKRWAALKAHGKSAAKPAGAKKRKLSAAGRKAIIAATRKRWAAYRKAGGKKGKAGAKAAAS